VKPEAGKKSRKLSSTFLAAASPSMGTSRFHNSSLSKMLKSMLERNHPGAVRNSSIQVRAGKGDSCHHAGSRSAGARGSERSIRQRQRVAVTAGDVALVVNTCR